MPRRSIATEAPLLLRLTARGLYGRAGGRLPNVAAGFYLPHELSRQGDGVQVGKPAPTVARGEHAKPPRSRAASGGHAAKTVPGAGPARVTLPRGGVLIGSHHAEPRSRAPCPQAPFRLARQPVRRHPWRGTAAAALLDARPRARRPGPRRDLVDRHLEPPPEGDSLRPPRDPRGRGLRRAAGGRAALRKERVAGPHRQPPRLRENL